jgi:hypothetical protein
MDKIDITVISCVVVVLVTCTIVAYYVAKQPKIEEYDDYITNAYPSFPEVRALFGNNMQVRNESVLNCYDYMKANGLGSWIDESGSRDSRNRMKVLGTLRTNMAHFDTPMATDAVTMHGCHIPKDVLTQVFQSGTDCVIRDTINNRQVQLDPTDKGCSIDFNVISRDAFDNVLDVAWYAYDKEHQGEAIKLEKEVKALENQVAEEEQHLKREQAEKKHFENATKMMIAYNESCRGDYCIMAKDCSIAKDENAEFIRREEARRVRNNMIRRAMHRLNRAINRLNADIARLDYFHGLYMRFK